ncbi:MAG: M15 family metallopeptidase [Verrucomicrobiota bacterium]
MALSSSTPALRLAAIVGLLTLYPSGAAQAQRDFGDPSTSLRRSQQQKETASSRPSASGKRAQVVVRDSAEAYRRTARADPRHEMVDLTEELPGVVFDLRYTTRRNFMREALYPPDAKPWARREVAERLARVQRDLAAEGLGLKIFDAYRPWSVTKRMWNSRQRLGISPRFLAPPWVGSNHNRGVALDLTLVDLATGRELEMPTGFDSFSERAHSSYPHLPGTIKNNREKLKTVMRRHGFATIRSEWWHFELANAGAFAVLDLDFSDFEKPAN